jgi:hypothetical protein
MHSNLVLPSTPRSSEWSLSFGISHQILLHFSVLFPARHMPRSPHSPWFDPPNDTCGWVQIMKPLLVQLSPFSSHFIPIWSKYLLRTLFSYTLSLCSSLNMRDPVSHPYKITGRILVLYILTFTFLDSRGEDKRLWTEWQQAFPEFSLLLISSFMQFDLLELFPNKWTLPHLKRAYSPSLCWSFVLPSDNVTFGPTISALNIFGWHLKHSSTATVNDR